MEVCEGELINLQGRILSVDGNKITIMPKHEELKVGSSRPIAFLHSLLIKGGGKVKGRVSFPFYSLTCNLNKCWFPCCFFPACRLASDPVCEGWGGGHLGSIPAFVNKSTQGLARRTLEAWGIEDSGLPLPRLATILCLGFEPH